MTSLLRPLQLRRNHSRDLIAASGIDVACGYSFSLLLHANAREHPKGEQPLSLDLLSTINLEATLLCRFVVPMNKSISETDVQEKLGALAKRHRAKVMKELAVQKRRRWIFKSGNPDENNADDVGSSDSAHTSSTAKRAGDDVGSALPP
jgi:hypothetical protein